MQSFLCTSARARRHSWSRPPCSRRPPASYPRCYAPYPNSLQPLPPKTSSLMTPHFFQKNLLTTGGESTPNGGAPSTLLTAGLSPRSALASARPAALRPAGRAGGGGVFAGGLAVGE